MNIKTKVNLYYFISFFIICILISFLLDHLFDLDEGWRSGIAGFLTVLLSPRFKVINAQSGQRIQVTSLLFYKYWNQK
ncbi:MAG: hypothetical protein ACEPOZ_18305 [Marinifilaceae bacterium]|jgi:hypothetical protein